LSYYYLAASLPELTLREAPPLELEEFLDRSSCVLEKDDLQEVHLVLSGRAAEGRSGFSQCWLNAETQLRNAVVRVRASRYGLDARDLFRSHKGFDLSIEKAVAAAFARATPLRQELALDRLRWEILDDLARTDRFGLPVILAFVLKLRMVERWWAMSDEKGEQRVAEFVEQNIELRMPEWSGIELS